MNVTLDPELATVAQSVLDARSPVMIFGTFDGALTPEQQHEQVKSTYRRLVKVLHPDMYRDAAEAELATRAFSALNALSHRAHDQISAGTYGEAERIRIQATNGVYLVGDVFPLQDSVSALYRCTIDVPPYPTHEGLFKIARTPRDSALLMHEQRALTAICSRPDAKRFSDFIPLLIESFIYQDPKTRARKRVNVLQAHGFRFYSLEEIRHWYPDGIDARDAVWIVRRLLLALGHAHRHRVINGGIIPPHVWIRPSHHTILLPNWYYAVIEPSKAKQHIRAVDTQYVDWYPSEVMRKEEATPGLDISMVMQCFAYLLGGDGATATIPRARLDTREYTTLNAFVRGCRLSAPMRPQDAWALHTEFTAMIEQLWGPRRWRSFPIPNTAQLRKD